MSKEKIEIYNIAILRDNQKEKKKITCSSDMDLLAAMQEQQIMLPSTCGGKGYCGKCKLRLMKGMLSITPEDRSFFSEAELEQGWRLACKAYPTADCTIRINGEEAGFEIITEHRKDLFIKQAEEQECSARKVEGQECSAKKAEEQECSEWKREEQVNCIKTETEQGYQGSLIKRAHEDKIYAIAVDIGTTTIVLSLISIYSGEVLWTYSAVNPQRTYGADVIARIQAANDGKQELLQELITDLLLQGIKKAVAQMKIEKAAIWKIAIACNTTMGHLLLGYSCEGLGRYPYTPFNISTIELPFYQAFNSEYLDVPVVVMPGISAFVGGDIVAGLLYCDFDKADKPCMLLDLGTNGEMAIGMKEKLLVASSAAGPAFEGGNISCGVGSVAGAISSIDIREGKTSFRTIGSKPPVGICGTGIIELASELLNSGLIDSTGLLMDKYFDEGFPIIDYKANTKFFFTQRDIRQLQMAKAAVRAGADIITKEYGITYDEIDKVFLAGGFGLKLNLQKAVNIGLLPEELYDKIIPVGNSALGGAISYLIDVNAPIRVASILKAAHELQLSEHSDFNSLYPEQMYF